MEVRAMTHCREVYHRVWKVGKLTIQLRPNLQPGSAPGKLCKAYYEDGILWLWERTPLSERMHYISVARALADEGASGCLVGDYAGR
jgi:hypothetical protein